MRGRLGLVSGVAAAVIAVAGGLAYATGSFTGHVTSRSSAAASSSADPSKPGNNVGGLNTASPAVPLHTTTARPASAGSSVTDTSQALCKAWLDNPWRPGAKDWDEEDFDKLSGLAGSPQLVLFYCWTKLPPDYWGPKPAIRYPARYFGGRWAWTPPDGKAQGPGNSGSSGGNAPFGASSTAAPSSTPAAGNGNSQQHAQSRVS